MASAGSCRSEEAQNHQFDIGIARRAGKQIHTFACRAADERRLDSFEQLRYRGFAIGGSGLAAPDLRDQLGTPIGWIALCSRIPLGLKC
jgi:hypothetical protein